MSKENKKKKFSINNLLRLAFLVATFLPIVMNLIPRNTLKILSRKVDIDYYNCLRIILSQLANEENFITKNSELLSQVHVTFYREAKNVVSINEKQVAEFTQQQKIFLDKNNKFSSTLYKEFLIKHNITENTLLKVMEEILCNNYYKKFLENGLDTIHYSSNKIIHEIINKKNINYNIYKLKENSFTYENPTKKQLEEIYETEKQQNNNKLFSPVKRQGFLLRKKINYNENKETISENAIKEYYEKNKNKYVYKKLTLHYIPCHNKQEAENIINAFNNKQKTLLQINEEYQVITNKLDSDNHPEALQNLFHAYQKYGLNQLILWPNPNQYIVVYISEYDCRDKLLTEVKQRVRTDIQEKLFMENSIKEFQEIKEFYYKINSINKGNDENILREMKNLKNKNIIITFETMEENEDNLNLFLNTQQKYRINNGYLEEFIVTKKFNKKLIPFKDINEQILLNLYKNELHKKYRDKANVSMIKYLKEGISSSSLMHTPIQNLWESSNGNINILAIVNDINNLEKYRNILHYNRNIISYNKDKNVIVKTNVYQNSLEIGTSAELIIKKEIERFINTVKKEEFIITFSGKISYYKIMAKYKSFFPSML